MRFGVLCVAFEQGRDEYPRIRKDPVSRSTRRSHPSNLSNGHDEDVLPCALRATPL